MKIALFLLLSVISCSKIENIKPHESFTDKDIAIKIAKTKWDEVYGKEVMAKEQPLKAKKLNDSIWFVQGTLNNRAIGGVAFGKIDIKNKVILSYSHGE